MSPEQWLHIIALRLRSIFQRRQVDSELDEELRYHIDMQIEENVAKGMNRDEARRSALLVLGGLDQKKEECRDARGLRILEDIVRDVQVSLRFLSKSPGISFLLILSLGLAIGPCIMLFSIVDGIFLRPSPIPQSSQLYRIGSRKSSELEVSYQDYQQFQNAVGASARVFGGAGSQVILSTTAGPKVISMFFVNDSFFEGLSVHPIIGRVLLREDDHLVNAYPALISHSLWQREFAGDNAILGRRILLNGITECTVVGVMPRAFRLPGKNPLPIDLWIPIHAAASIRKEPTYLDHSNRRLSIWLRLQDMRQKARVEAILTGIMAETSNDKFRGPFQNKAVLYSIEDIEGGGRQISYFLLILVGLVLMIACANIACVRLAQGEVRLREFAIRQAIGSSRYRLIRQLLTETIILSVCGALIGLVLSRLLIVVCSYFLPSIPISVGFDFRLDARVLTYTLFIICLTVLASGLAPALRVVRPDLFSLLHGNPLHSVAHSRFRIGLLITQVAISNFMLVGSGFLLHSYLNLVSIRPGFDPSRRLLLIELANLKPVDYKSGIAALTGLPGVEAVAYSHSLPLSPLGSGSRIKEVTLLGSKTQSVSISYNKVGPGYLSLLGTRFLQGEDFRSDQNEGIIINEQMARRFWGSINQAMGNYVRTDDKNVRIVGVVEDGKYGDLLEKTAPYMFLPDPTNTFSGQRCLVIAISGTESSITSEVRRVIETATPGAYLYSFRSMAEHMRLARFQQEIGAELMGILGLLGILLAAGGIYGLLAYQVTHQRRELGLRIALGAQRSHVLMLVVRQTVIVVSFGALIGVACAICLAHFASSLLFQVTSIDPLGISSAFAILCAVALLAALQPLRRAITVDPAAVLKLD